jgi:SAM-dependent methyltransferase
MKDYLNKYLQKRPLFLSLIRAREAILYKPIMKRTKVLDFGCGDGFFAEVVFGKQAIEIGLDVGDSRITTAAREAVYKETRIYDGKKIPFGDDTFDLVVSNCVFEHLPDLEANLSEIWRILKKKGVLEITVMARPWEDYLVGAMLLGHSYKDWMRRKQIHINLLPAKEWRKKFRDAGFEVIEEVGYLSKSACKLLDIAHYASLPSLISYKLSGRWVWWQIPYPTDLLCRIMKGEVQAEESGAIYYRLSKKLR